MPPYTIRPATPADAAAIARVHVRGWQEGYKGIVPSRVLDAMSVEKLTQRWIGLLAEKDGMYRNVTVTETGGRIVGWGNYGAYRDDTSDPQSGEVYGFYFDPNWWGSGLSRPLMETVLAGLKAENFTHAYVWTLEKNRRSIRFYQKCGFTLDGAEKPYTHHNLSLTQSRLGIDL